MLEVTEHTMKVINYESNQTTKYDNPAEVNHDVIWPYRRKYNYLFHLSPYNCDVHIKSRSQKLVIVEWAKGKGLQSCKIWKSVSVCSTKAEAGNMLIHSFENNNNLKQNDC